MEKYGFVYIWFDRYRKMYYIGRHWGNFDDGYICSSNRMRDAYRRRPLDFKRKILSKITSSFDDLILEEQKWLDKIDPKKCGSKYYNISLNAKMPSTRGFKHSEETKKRIKDAATGRKLTIETKEKLRQANLGKTYSKEVNAKKGITSRDYSDVEFRNKISYAAKNRSIETRKKISENNKRLQAEGKIGMKGKKHSPETIEKMRFSALNRITK